MYLTRRTLPEDFEKVNPPDIGDLRTLWRRGWTGAVYAGPYPLGPPKMP